MHAFYVRVTCAHFSLALVVRDVVKMIYRQDGVTGYFRGLTTTWARDISGYFVFFTAKFKLHQELGRAPLRITGEAFSVIASLSEDCLHKSQKTFFFFVGHCV